MPKRKATAITGAAAETRLQRNASLALVFGGALWGLFWIPLRLIGETGLAGAWPGLVIYLGTVLLFLPLAVRRRSNLAAQWRQLALAGMFTGGAFSLYASSLLLTDVVRAILLFYLTPVWGTLLGLWLLRERLSLARAAALVCGLAGLFVVLGSGGGVPSPHNLGDWLALASGISWAIGSLMLFRIGRLAAADQALAFVGGSLAVTAACIAVGGDALGMTPSMEIFLPGLFWGLLAACLLPPMIFLTVWPATLLSPGRVGLLLMSEVVIGAASAAVLSGEPFGWRETIGTVLIVTAAAIEVLGQPRSR